MSTPAPPTAGPSNARWNAWLGWTLGGLAGLMAGFALTAWIDVAWLAPRGADGVQWASRLSAVVPPSGFLVGAWGGHALGRGLTARRLPALAAATSLTLALAAWLLLRLAR